MTAEPVREIMYVLSFAVYLYIARMRHSAVRTEQYKERA